MELLKEDSLFGHKTDFTRAAAPQHNWLVRCARFETDNAQSLRKGTVCCQHEGT